MKKIFILSLLLFCIIFPKSIVFAEESSPSAVSSPTAVMTNDYTLPYPGILPDNPLYFFKVARDNIIVFFISSPLKKAAFYLLQSDKRLEASWYLLKKGASGNDLALSTLSKSTNYLSLALNQLRLAKESGEDVSALQGKLIDATAKHIAVVESIKNSPSVKKKDIFAKEEQRLRDLQKVVSRFSSQE